MAGESSKHQDVVGKTKVIYKNDYKNDSALSTKILEKNSNVKIKVTEAL